MDKALQKELEKDLDNFFNNLIRDLKKLASVPVLPIRLIDFNGTRDEIIQNSKDKLSNEELQLLIELLDS